MERKLILLALAAALVGCGEPAGVEGKSVSVDELNKSRTANAPADDVPPPAPPSDAAPGSGK